MLDFHLLRMIIPWRYRDVMASSRLSWSSSTNERFAGLCYALRCVSPTGHVEPIELGLRLSVPSCPIPSRPSDQSIHPSSLKHTKLCIAFHTNQPIPLWEHDDTQKKATWGTQISNSRPCRWPKCKDVQVQNRTGQNGVEEEEG